jgi:DNA-binding MarR family transcriptional regulator
MPSNDFHDEIKNMSMNCLSVRMRMLNRIVAAIFDEALRSHGIRASQLNILVAVSAYGPVTSRQLCQVLHMDTSTFSRAITRLKEKGWLHSEPSGEGKILKIQTTKKGLEKIKQVHPDWEKAQATVTKVLGDSTAETIIAAGNKHLLEGMTG